MKKEKMQTSAGKKALPHSSLTLLNRNHTEYPDSPDKIIIKDFSAHVKPGQQVAIVGPTGAGKTTMVKLLMRFYDVNGGAILLDGHNIKDFNRRELRDVFGMVLQDTWLYNASIRDNIRYGKLDASEEEIQGAGVKMTGYQRFLNEVQKEVPTITSQGYWGKNGKFYQINDKGSPYYGIIQKYRMIQYNMMFDKKNRRDSFFEVSK